MWRQDNERLYIDTRVTTTNILELENLKMILMVHGQMQYYMREKAINTCEK